MGLIGRAMALVLAGSLNSGNAVWLWPSGPEARMQTAGTKTRPRRVRGAVTLNLVGGEANQIGLDVGSSWRTRAWKLARTLLSWALRGKSPPGPACADL
jgi:hypothetical protein